MVELPEKSKLSEEFKFAANPYAPAYEPEK